jgi:parallel beta-helix repeat protein
LSNNSEGVILESSLNATILDNIFQNIGIIISGLKTAWNTHIIENNTANDKPIYYYKNENRLTVPNDANQIILANCSNIEIKNINFENMKFPIQIGYSSNIRIESNNFESSNQNAMLLYQSDNNLILNNTINCVNGIDLSQSENNNIRQNAIECTNNAIIMTHSKYNTITENNIYSNSEYGIYIQASSNNNIISKNILFNNHIGIRLKSSKNNNIHKNEFNNNSYKGLYICCNAQNNTIFNNSFIKNLEHVDYTVSKLNFFYSQEIGNYWDDYLERYPNAMQLNGVWDKPYKIPFSSYEDKYPLVKPVDI